MTYISRILPVVALLAATACSGQKDIEAVAVGQDIALVKTDGGLVEGTVARVDDTELQVASGPTNRSIPKEQIAELKVVDRAMPAPPPPPAAKFREYTVPVGTPLAVRLTAALTSRTARVEDRVEATLIEPVSIGGAEVLPAGSRLTGTVTAVDDSGKVKGRAHITVHFTRVTAVDRDVRDDLDATYAETAAATKSEDATKIGIGAGAGAVIGGLLGGKGGAAKGAAIGGGAGTAVVLGTKGKDVDHAAGARLTVRLRRDLDVRVPID